MNLLNLLILIVISCQYMVLAQNYACSDNFCRSSLGVCPEFRCKGKNLITLQNATKCGCCHWCVTRIG